MCKHLIGISLILRSLGRIRVAGSFARVYDIFSHRFFVQQWSRFAVSPVEHHWNPIMSWLVTSVMFMTLLHPWPACPVRTKYTAAHKPHSLVRVVIAFHLQYCAQHLPALWKLDSRRTLPGQYWVSTSMLCGSSKLWLQKYDMCVQSFRKFVQQYISFHVTFSKCFRCYLSLSPPSCPQISNHHLNLLSPIVSL